MVRDSSLDAMAMQALEATLGLTLTLTLTLVGYAGFGSDTR